MKERKIKLVSAKEAIAQIEDDSSVLVCGSLIRRHPMALVHEMIRQNKRNLTLYGWNNSIDFDMLIGCGLAKEAHSSYVGMSNLGMCKNFRRACQEQKIRYVEHSETTAMDRLMAGYQGLTFAISKTPLNNDMKVNKEYQTDITCPFTGEKYTAMRAWNPDYAILHAARSDKYGNVQFDRRRMMDNETDIFISKATKKIIVSVEEIVSEETIIESNDLTVLPKMFVDCVVEAPYGAHPNSCDCRYDFDIEHVRYYQECCETPEGFEKYMKEYVYGTKDWNEYLEKIGMEHLLKITRSFRGE
ncbi:MAG TPA: CoA-transferase [Bacillota bacterium]|nr:CoA-transferase [Bacillota bacterium]